jgi:hypothetical protein
LERVIGGKTAVERLEILANSDKTDQDLENAFSVEALSDSFFKEYKQFYEAFVEYITGYRYVKKGCKWENTYIHEPDPQFANFKNNQKLVRDYIKKMLGRIVFLYFIQRKGWLNDDSNYMENLFLDSSDEQKNNFLDSVLKPLFFGLLNTLPKDRATIYINNVSPATLPGHKTIPYLNGGLFQQEEIDKCQLQFRADLFDGLFKFLGSYNFTIDENDPDDVEIGIDPEMLGCIFENLLEDNRDKGAYYTPKEIVHYMCRESLIAYLQTDKNNEEKDQIKRFVTNHNAQELREQVSDIDKKLQTVKICDPAIGSGAFPMGMLKELFACRQAIERPNSPDFKASTIKREIIRKNIYGVDIEKGAVDIARLRFWLALIIDEDNPETLPNLDFKIMQGNSLLEGYYKGNTYIDLSTLLYEKEKKNEEKNWLYNEEERNMERLQLRSYIKSYYNEDNHKKKEKLRSKIHGNILNQLHSINLCNSGLEDIDISANSQFFLWHTWFSDVFSRPSKEGFDIMIGNPPYVEAKKLKGIASQLKGYEVSSGTADLSVYFMELALRLIRVGGQMCFITTNKFFNTGYGKKVRRILTLYHIKELVNFEQVEVFEGILVSSVVLEITKEAVPSKNRIRYKQYYKLNNKQFKTQFTGMIEDYAQYPQSFLNEDEWSFVDLYELELKQLIEKGHPALGSIEGVNIYRGVTTGYNPAFIIDSEQKDKLIAEDSRSAEIIKDMLQGRNIRKWYYNKSEEYLIFTRRGIDISLYPSVKSHLSLFYPHLVPRKANETGDGRKPGNYQWFEILDNTAYYREFEKPKIIWGLTADKWAFSFDDSNHYLPSNAWILTSKVIPLKYILGVLNSNLIKYYFGFIGVMTAGGAFTLKGASISALPFCISNDTQKVITIVDSILQKKNSNHNADISVEEELLNKVVYGLYGIDKTSQKFIQTKVSS